MCVVYCLPLIPSCVCGLLFAFDPIVCVCGLLFAFDPIVCVCGLLFVFDPIVCGFCVLSWFCDI